MKYKRFIIFLIIWSIFWLGIYYYNENREKQRLRMIEVERIWDNRESKDLEPIKISSREFNVVLSKNASIYQEVAEEIIEPTKELLRYEGMIKYINK